jgi:hypothetical protein
MNKEDLWVSRIPVPIVRQVRAPFSDSFESPEALQSWNVYSPQWAPVSVAEFEGNGVLKLEDRDHSDYAKAVRVFPESERPTVRFKINLQSNREGHFEIDVLDRYGTRALTIKLVSGRDVIWVTRGTAIAQVGGYEEGRWHEFEMALDARAQTYSLSLDGDQKLTDEPFHRDNVGSLERIELRTGFYRREDSIPYIHLVETEYAQPSADEPVRASTILIDDLSIR